MQTEKIIQDIMMSFILPVFIEGKERYNAVIRFNEFIKRKIDNSVIEFNKMNETINSIITDYITLPTSDFAYLITGAWGSGKTYYVNNELKYLIRECKKKYLYISLNGLTDVNKIKEIVLLKVISKKMGSDITEDTIENIIQFGQAIPGSNVIMSSLLSIKKTTINIISNKLSLDDTVIIFDDLERLGKGIDTIDVIAFIYELLIRNNVKVIFVADESKIIGEDDSKADRKYTSRREKVIKRTIAYLPEFQLQLSNFIEHKYKTSDYYKKIIEVQDVLMLLFKERPNLRTVAFIIDSYLTILSKIDMTLDNAIYSKIFNVIAVFAYEFKEGELTSNHIKTNRKLELINSSHLFWGLDKKKEEEKEYYEKFVERYQIQLGIDIRYIKPIFDYVLTGFLDIELLKKEIAEVYCRKRTVQEEVLETLTNAHILEYSQLQDAIAKVIAYLLQGDYSLFSLPSIYILIRNIEKKQYLAKFPSSIEETFKKAVQKSKEKETTSSEGSTYEICDDDESDYEGSSFAKDDTFLFIRSCIKDFCKEKQDNNIDKKIKQLFIEANNDSKHFYTLSREFRTISFFTFIVNTNNVELFKTLNNQGINNIQNILRQQVKITVSEDGEAEESASLERIKLFLLGMIEEEKDIMRKARLNELINSLMRSIAHMKKKTPDIID